MLNRRLFTDHSLHSPLERCKRQPVPSVACDPWRIGEAGSSERSDSTRTRTTFNPAWSVPKTSLSCWISRLLYECDVTTSTHDRSTQRRSFPPALRELLGFASIITSSSQTRYTEHSWMTAELRTLHRACRCHWHPSRVVAHSRPSPDPPPWAILRAGLKGTSFIACDHGSAMASRFIRQPVTQWRSDREDREETPFGHQLDLVGSSTIRGPYRNDQKVLGALSRLGARVTVDFSHIRSMASPEPTFSFPQT